MYHRSKPSFVLGDLKSTPKRSNLSNPKSQFRFSETNQVTFGEAVESLKCFWYVSFQLPERNPDQDDSSDEVPSNSEDKLWGIPVRNDWGIHVNSDCLFETATMLANKMEEEGVENPLMTALWLYFAFGFQHEYFHHVVDSQIALHESRTKLDFRTEENVSEDESSKKLRLEYLNLYDKHMVQKENADWWLFLEEALANASVVVETSQLSDLQHIFVHYGLLPTPGDVNFGPYSLWENAIESDGWNLLSSYVWLQHLQASHDPFCLLAGLETIKNQKGKSNAFQKFCESFNDFLGFPMLKDLIKLKGARGRMKNSGFGVFNPQSDGILSRLEIPIIIHGSRKKDLLNYLESDWPHSAIEHLYNSFSTKDSIQEDPFSDDDEFEFVA